MIKNIKGWTLVEMMIVLAIIGLVASMVLGFLTSGGSLSSGTGEKVGQIVKLSKEGVVHDTWEGELIRGGMNNGSGSFGTTPFDFTVEDRANVERVQQFMKDQTEVIIKYRKEAFYLPTRSDSKGYFLVSIEPAKKEVKKETEQ